MKILEKILSKDKKSKFPVTKNLNIEIDIQKESILPYGSSVILKKYPAIGGIISSSIFHSKDKKQMYFIHINGKSKTKRYIKDDFILDLKGSWGYYPWFPEDGDHFINPCDLENFKNIIPYGKIFNCIDDTDEYITLQHKKMTFKVKKELYKIINNHELISEKYNLIFSKNFEKKISNPVNLWGHYLGSKNDIFENFSLLEQHKKDFFLKNGKILQCIGKEDNFLLLKYYEYILKVEPELFRVIPAPLSFGDIVTLTNNPKIKGIITDMYWNYPCREYIYILTINGKKRTKKFLMKDFI